MFTVAIPAFNRPELLRNTLLSVANQSRRDLISRVIVSENGLNRGSELVCREFPELQIEYVFHEVQLPVLQHLKWILSQSQNDYVAMLCDDDWWDINHLSLAHQTLLSHAECIAYFSNFTHSKDTVGLRGPANYWNGGMHIGNLNFKNHAPTVFNALDVLTLGLLFTPFHFSALVCKAVILSEAVNIFDEIHPTVADRLLWAHLVTFGPFVFNPLPTAIILQHPTQDSHKYADIWPVQLQKGSFKILEIAERENLPLKQHVNDSYKRLEPVDTKLMERGLLDNFYEVDNLSWFVGQAAIISVIEWQAQQLAIQRSFKRRAIRTIKRLVKKII